ncbi:uncharacterized protein LOC131628546 isoform X1 [Vicia villosa]|uniref:uncharacterized protein LOC131628546 isoform X1 n=1 Tax=Vicia villosa TaxID=3911 RepID=UPI00273C0B96|nr:uncharacterized protein LOC131628546 isoform X1 [Vicia villosa]XP_058755359.1 uncharacterized protein LOC131628546 isoform X1 [Vicia villosa]
MSATETDLVKIFDKKKQIVEQVRQESLLWEHNLIPLLIFNGIPPPPWLANSALHSSFPSDPKDLFKDDTVYQGQPSQTQFGVPSVGDHCSLYNNLDAVSDDLHNEVHAFNKDHDTGGRLSNLPDCSVSNAGCASSGPPELDSVAVSPQTQIGQRVSEGFFDPAVSLSKLHRSRSRQKALEQRNSAKASKLLSRDGDNAGDCTAAATRSAPPSLQEDHNKELSLVNEFHPNNRRCLTEEMRRGDCLTQKDNSSNYTGRITRSKSSSQKFNSLCIGRSSVEKEVGPPLNDLNEEMELINRPSFINGSCGVQEPNIIDFQKKDIGSSVYDKRLSKPRSSSQAEHSSELLNLDSTSERCKVVEVSDLNQPCSHVELTDLSKTSDCINGSRRNIVKDGDFCQTEQKSNIQSRLKLHRSSYPSPGDDFFSTNGSAKSIDKSVQFPQPLILKNLQDPSADIVRSLCSQKEPHISALKTKEYLSRSASGNVYLTRNSKLSMFPNSNSRRQRAARSESAGKKSQNVQPTKLETRRLSSSPKYSKVDLQISVNSAEKENIAEVDASRNTRAETSCTEKSSVRPARSSNLDGGSILAESFYIKIVAEKDFDVLENIASDANSTDNAKHKSATTTAKVHLDFDGIVDKDPSCLGSTLTSVNPKVREEVSVSRLSPDFVMSEMPKELVFDDGEETNRDGICSPDLKGSQRKSPDKEPLALSEPLKSPDDDTQEVLADFFSEAVTENGLPRHTDKSVTKSNAVFSVSVPTDEVNVDLAQQAPDAISWDQNGELLRQASNGKVTSFSTDVHNFNSSPEGFTNDLEHSCSQHKKRKIEIESEKFLPDSTHLMEKLVDSNNQRPASGTSSIKEDNPETVIEVQHIAFDQADDIGHERVSKSPIDVIKDTRESQKMEGSSSTVRKDEQKLISDGRGRESDTLILPEAEPFNFSSESARFTFDGKAGSWYLQVNSGQNNAEHLTSVERTTPSRRIYPEGDTEFVDGLSVSPRFRDLDSIDTGEALPEFEGFIIETDNEPYTARDEMDFKSINLPSNSADNSSLDGSRFTCSPSCYSSTPYKLPSITNVYRSLPDGLLEGYGLRTSRPLNDGSPRSVSDYRPKSSVQTLRDRFTSNFGSSGKRMSSKPELPCISEENENVDEIAGTFQQGIGPEGMTESITDIVENANPSTSVLQDALASEQEDFLNSESNFDGTFQQGIGPEGMTESITKIVENANPSTSVLQDALASEQEDFVISEYNFDGTHNKVKKKLDKQDGNRTRLTSKGKDNKSISLGANGAKRNSESVHKRSSRPKLSGKDSMKLQRPTFSGRKSTRKNIVSNITSFIPLVQQKQAAAVLPGKKVIKIKALKAAEAAKRNDEMKENERKKKKEVLMELQKKKEERKKEEAKMTAKKRPRENEEKKEKEEKRKRVNDMKQREHGKILAKKEELKGKEVRESRKIVDGRDDRDKLLLQENRQDNAEKISDTEHLTKESCHEKYESQIECANKGKATMEDNDLIIKNSPLEQSYEMSPYKSDDDEDEDDRPSNKFIPSWASKHSLLLAVSSQAMDPETIFPRQSFCNIAEALLPRKFRL